MNSARLEYEMKIRGIGISDMCKRLNMSRTAFYRKRNGQSEFNRKEIQAILDMLGLKSPMGIFFNPRDGTGE